MHKAQLKLLLLGKSEPILQQQKKLLSKVGGYEVEIRLVPESAQNPFEGMNNGPDVAVLNLSAKAEVELGALAERHNPSLPSLVLIGAESDQKYLRLALQIGARDFLCPPLIDQQLVDCLLRIHKEKSTETGNHNGKLIAVMSAKGGSGATFLACNLAHIVSTTSSLSVAALDLDLQFATLALYLDLSSEQHLLEVLENIGDLDGPALDGYMSKHKSGLRLLASSNERVVLPSEIPEENLNQLIQLMLKTYDRVFVDLPRQIDSVTGTVLANAGSVIIVLQQNLTSIRDATILKRILMQELDVPAQNISFVINRLNSNTIIEIKDISETLDQQTIRCVPNDHKTVSAALDLGIPLHEYANKSGITKSLIKLTDVLELIPEESANKRKGIFKRMFPGLKILER